MRVNACSKYTTMANTPQHKTIHRLGPHRAEPQGRAIPSQMDAANTPPQQNTTIANISQYKKIDCFSLYIAETKIFKIYFKLT